MRYHNILWMSRLKSQSKDRSLPRGALDDSAGASQRKIRVGLHKRWLRRCSVPTGDSRGRMNATRYCFIKYFKQGRLGIIPVER
jgi:hypothetical protein